MKKKYKLPVMIMLLSLLTLPYQNCGSSFDSGTSNSLSTGLGDGDPISSSDWVVDPEPIFNEGSNDTYDLTETLPSDVKPNGTFGVDTASAPSLPSGMTLDPFSGILSVNSAMSGTTNGVVFTYTEPN